MIFCYIVVQKNYILNTFWQTFYKNIIKLNKKILTEQTIYQYPISH